MSAEEIVRQERIHQELKQQAERERQVRLLQEKTNSIRQDLQQGNYSFTLERIIYLCFESSKARGWWHNLETLEFRANRNKAEMICLMHSEVSEAYEAWVTGESDDKLPNRNGCEVELADALIRIFDFAVGFQSETFFKELIYDLPIYGYGITRTFSLEESFQFCQKNETVTLLDVHMHLSCAMEAVRKDKDWGVHLSDAAVACVQFANNHEFDLANAVIEKMRYNMSRKDHDIGERMKEGGKKF